MFQKYPKTRIAFSFGPGIRALDYQSLADLGSLAFKTILSIGRKLRQLFLVRDIGDDQKFSNVIGAGIPIVLLTRYTSYLIDVPNNITAV